MKKQDAWKWLALGLCVATCCGFPCYLGNHGMIVARGCNQQTLNEVIDCMGTESVLVGTPTNSSEYVDVATSRARLEKFTGSVSIYFEYQMTLCSGSVVLECRDGKVIGKTIDLHGCT